MSALACASRLDGALVVVTMAGVLSPDTAPTARTAMLSALAEGPAAVLLDCAGLSLAGPGTVSALAVSRPAHAVGPSAPVAICRPDDTLRAALTGRIRGGPALFDSVADARAAVTRSVRVPFRRVTRDLPFATDTPAHARVLVTDLCRDWDLPDLLDDVVIVVSELVANAVVHAKSPVRLVVAQRGRFLHLLVRDGSVRPPVHLEDSLTDPMREGGRGMGLVDTYSAAWGVLPVEGGKAVWATLRIR